MTVKLLEGPSNTSEEFHKKVRNSQENFGISIGLKELPEVKKEFPMNYKELPALFWGVHREILEVQAPKKA